MGANYDVVPMWTDSSVNSLCSTEMDLLSTALIVAAQATQTYTLLDLSKWLQLKSRAKRIAERAVELHRQEKPWTGKERQPPRQVSSIYLSTASEMDGTPKYYNKERMNVERPKALLPLL